MQDNARYLANVRAQYEALPYPARDPEEERTRLIRTEGDHLATLNHFCYRGRRDFGDFRALVAGSGTGDATIHLAAQLERFPGAGVISIDISEASNDVARARARVRGLKNITFLHGSLLDLDEMDLEPFDYINCSGVLHHLADPDAGLNALKAVLKSDGAMGLMLYATYGRTGIYQMQALMRLVNGDERDIQAKVDNTKAVLGCLPPSNWLKRGEDLVHDHKLFGDVGVYDLFLHEQDRAYTVPEVYDFVERAGLKLVEYYRPRDRVLLDPEACIPDASLLERVRARDLRTQRAVAELMTGRLIKHDFYVAATADTVASPDDLDNVPFLTGGFKAESSRALAAQVRQAPRAPVEINAQIYRYSFQPGRHTAAIFDHLDGERSLGEIYAAVRGATGAGGPSDADLAADFAPVYARMVFGGHLLLRHRSVPAYVAPPAAPAGAPPEGT
jgi:SAM-dependent methyltransferase